MLRMQRRTALHTHEERERREEREREGEGIEREKGHSLTVHHSGHYPMIMMDMAHNYVAVL